MPIVPWTHEVVNGGFDKLKILADFRAKNTSTSKIKLFFVKLRLRLLWLTRKNRESVAIKRFKKPLQKAM